MRKLLTAILSFALVLMTMANLATLPAQAAPSPSEEAAQLRLISQSWRQSSLSSVRT